MVTTLLQLSGQTCSQYFYRNRKILRVKNFTVLSIAILFIVKVTINCMQQEIKIIFLSNIIISVVESLIHQVSLHTNCKRKYLLDS